MATQSEFSIFIGRLAERTGLTLEAIRSYEAQGLLKSGRTQQRYRVYTEAHEKRLHLIKKASELGFTVPEIAEFLDALDFDDSGDVITSMVNAKLAQLEARADGLRALQNALQTAAGEELSGPELIDRLGK